MSTLLKIVPILKNKLNEFSTFRLRIVWFLITMFSLGGMIDIPASSLLPVSTASAFMVIVLIAMFKGTLITLMLLFTRAVKWLNIVVKLFIMVFCVLCAINAIGYGLFDMGITIKMMTVIGQTNLTEVSEFLPTAGYGILSLFRNPYTYLVIIISGACIGILKIIPRRCYVLLNGVCSATGLVCSIGVFFLLPAGRTNFPMSLRVLKSAIYAHREMCQIHEELSKVKPLPYSETVRSSCMADIIMVIGESSNRSNMSLYGYELSTTPKLDKLKDQLIIFTDVIGSSTLTSYNMNRILTFLSDSDRANGWNKQPMLFSLMNQAGYHTAWLSNQEKSGIWGNSTVAMVSTASTVRFVGSTSSDDATLQKYDGLLLPELDDVLKSVHGAKFIGVHLMGSHTEYRRRYPETFGRFTADSIRKTDSGKKLTKSQATTRAEYDNSILYTDSLLDSIINMISTAQRPTLLIYFSDHGENVYDGGEDYRGRDDRHVEVPFVIYYNQVFSDTYPSTVARLKEVSHKPMTTASLSHLLCTLTGTSYKAYDPTRDITSSHYQIRPRYVDNKVWKYEYYR